MKKFIFAAALLASCLTIKVADAQIKFSLGVNIGSQPDWGPVGYDHASYYYMPDIDAYYDVNSHQYVYFENNVWVHRGYLPARYAHYDLYHGYKVVINDRDPWLRHSVYHNRYLAYRGRRDQHIIRYATEAKYKNHWRDARLDARNRNLNQRDNRLDNRAQDLRQRDRQQDQRARELNEKQRKINEERARQQREHDHH